MKRRGINYNHLWIKPKMVHSGHREVFYKKALDNLCLMADLELDVVDYVRQICSGLGCVLNYS